MFFKKFRIKLRISQIFNMCRLCYSIFCLENFIHMSSTHPYLISSWIILWKRCLWSRENRLKYLESIGLGRMIVRFWENIVTRKSAQKIWFFSEIFIKTTFKTIFLICFSWKNSRVQNQKFTRWYFHIIFWKLSLKKVISW